MQHFPAPGGVPGQRLIAPNFDRVTRAATATVGFSSSRDQRSHSDSLSGSEVESLAEQIASNLHKEDQRCGARRLQLPNESMIYSKNNVCVHSTASPPSTAATTTAGPGETIHVPGYLSVRCRGPSILGVGSSLILHWIPNVQMTGAAYGSGDVDTAPQRLGAASAAAGSPASNAGLSYSYSGSAHDSLPKDVSTFTTDLGQMRSVKIFYNVDDRTCGQLVIASKSNQFRVLHFHHGGLPSLYMALQDWPMSSLVMPRTGDVSTARIVFRDIA